MKTQALQKLPGYCTAEQPIEVVSVFFYFVDETNLAIKVIPHSTLNVKLKADVYGFWLLNQKSNYLICSENKSHKIKVIVFDTFLSGLIHVGDEIHEINGIKFMGRNPDDMANLLVNVLPLTLLQQLNCVAIQPVSIKS